MTNKAIENYILKQKVGQGQYGNVYLAENTRNKETVAIKVMNIQKFKTTPKLSEFTSNEISILTKINNVHIIKFMEMLRTANNYYLVYQYCNGGTLEDRLKKKKIMKEAEALKIFAQMREAFKVLVSEKILHRDIKPTNILFNDDVVKLADFGFCKELLKETDMAMTMVGSPIYMAPEVLKGRQYNSKADIWSMGVVLYEMLFGYCPYEENTIAKLMNLIDQRPLKIPADINSVSQSTRNLIRKMLVVDVTRRISPAQLIEYKLAVEEEKPSNKAEELLQHNREHLAYMFETGLMCAENANTEKDKIILCFLLNKMLMCYQRELKRKSKYWQIAKVSGLPEKLDTYIEEELEHLKHIEHTLKESMALMDLNIKIKIELETFYVDLKTMFDRIEALPNSLLKLRLFNSFLMYKHMHCALERNQLSIVPVVVKNEQTDLANTLNKKGELCRQYTKNVL